VLRRVERSTLWLPLRNRHFQGERLATRFAKTLRFSRRSLRERPRVMLRHHTLLS